MASSDCSLSTRALSAWPARRIRRQHATRKVDELVSQLTLLEERVAFLESVPFSKDDTQDETADALLWSKQPDPEAPPDRLTTVSYSRELLLRHRPSFTCEFRATDCAVAVHPPELPAFSISAPVVQFADVLSMLETLEKELTDKLYAQHGACHSATSTCMAHGVEDEEISHRSLDMEEPYHMEPPAPFENEADYDTRPYERWLKGLGSEGVDIANSVRNIAVSLYYLRELSNMTPEQYQEYLWDNSEESEEVSGDGDMGMSDQGGMGDKVSEGSLDDKDGENDKGSNDEMELPGFGTELKRMAAELKELRYATARLSSYW